MAQQRTGNIYGKVVDQEGNPLPGVTVTLIGTLTAPMTFVTSAEGKFRFLSLAPARDYALKAELQGFKTKVEEGIIVTVGTNVDITLVMEMGTLEEEITVVAATPVVDTKKTSIAQNVTQEVLQSLPTARDPWVILQLAPSVQVDRENIGGNESGQQTTFVSHGERSDYNNIWAIDGAVVTDVSSTASPIYYDFDAFEEMNITVGGNDVTAQTGGIVVNMVTRRGGNKLSLGGRFYITDGQLQDSNLTDALRKEGVMDTNKIEDIRDYGFNFGGPFVRDKAWYWVSYGVQDIKGFTILGTKDDTLLTNYNAKINLQLIPQNRFEVFGTMAEKEKWGRGASYETPLGTHQTNYFPLGSPILKFQDEHMFGDKLFVSAKWTYVNSGFYTKSMYNEDLAKIGKYNETTKQWDQHASIGGSSRPRKDLYILANYFNDNLLGLSHEIKVGFEYSKRTTYGLGESRAHLRYNYNTPTIDITGDKKPDIVAGIYQVRTSRYMKSSSAVDALSAYFSDTITKGRLNLILGLRWDRQIPWVPSFSVFSNVVKDEPAWKNNFTARTADAITKVCPPFEVPEVRPGHKWDVFSPRLGITWDVQGNGRTIAKLSFARYGDFMMTGEAGYFRPLGTGGWMYFWWLDANKDGIADLTELFWHRAKTYEPYRVFDDAGNFIGDWSDAKNIMWGAFDPYNPTQTTSPTYTVDKKSGSSRSQEVILSLEREIVTDFGVSLNLSYRRYDNDVWALPYYPDTGHKRSKADYVQVGTIPSQVGPYSTQDAAGKPYYLLKGDQKATSYYYVTRRPDYHDDYFGLDFVVNKRLSHRWMLNGSFTWQWQQVSHGENGYLNPTNLWAIDKRVYSPYIGAASGKISQYIFSRWLVKLSGLYQLPWDFNISGTFIAREGNIISEYFTLVDYNAPNPTDRSIDVYISKFGTLRLPTLWYSNLRLEKLLRAGDLKIYIMADVFNVLNNSIINRRYMRNLGTYYVHNGLFIPNPTNFMANEILNPRILRVGVRFQFN